MSEQTEYRHVSLDERGTPLPSKRLVLEVCVADLYLIGQALTPEECQNQLIYLPL